MLAGALLAVCLLAALLVLRTVTCRIPVGKKARPDRQMDRPSTKVLPVDAVPPGFFEAPTDEIVLGKPDRPPGS